MDSLGALDWIVEVNKRWMDG